MKIMKKSLSIALMTLLLAPQLVLAAEFNRNYILSELDLTNADSMNVTRVQKFLEAKNSGLATYSQNDPWGDEKTAAQIIYDAGKYWTISPQYILVRMQVEQSLTLATNPTQRQLDWATGYAVCDSCSTSDPAVQKSE